MMYNKYLKTDIITELDSIEVSMAVDLDWDVDYTNNTSFLYQNHTSAFTEFVSWIS